jgi:transcription antitermination protein NusB
VNARRLARELAFRACYQSDVTGEALDHCLAEILEETEPSEDASEFAKELVASLADHVAEIDATVSRIAKNWPLGRMAATDRSVIRMAAAELLYHAGTPTRVALDEAIEIAKKYGMETSGSFVNGILDRIAHEARPSVG